MLFSIHYNSSIWREEECEDIHCSRWKRDEWIYSAEKVKTVNEISLNPFQADETIHVGCKLPWDGPWVNFTEIIRILEKKNGSIKFSPFCKWY